MSAEFAGKRIRVALDGTLLLKRGEVAALLGLDECIAAVEQAFKLHAQGELSSPGILGIRAEQGGFHVKAGLMNFGPRSYFVSKTNANFPGNMKRFGLPLIQGTIVPGPSQRLLLDARIRSVAHPGRKDVLQAGKLCRGRFPPPA